jgi:hypothetical protein
MGEQTYANPFFRAYDETDVDASIFPGAEAYNGNGNGAWEEAGSFYAAPRGEVYSIPHEAAWSQQLPPIALAASKPLHPPSRYSSSSEFASAAAAGSATLASANPALVAVHNQFTGRWKVLIVLSVVLACVAVAIAVSSLSKQTSTTSGSGSSAASTTDALSELRAAVAALNASHSMIPHILEIIGVLNHTVTGVLVTTSLLSPKTDVLASNVQDLNATDQLVMTFLTGPVASMNATIFQQQATLVNTRPRLDAFDGAVNSLNATVASQQNALSSAMPRLEALSGAMRSLTVTAASQQISLSTTLSHMASLSTTVASQQSALSSAMPRLDALSGAMRSLTVTAASQQISLSTTLSHMASSSATVSSQQAILSSRLDTLSGAMSALSTTDSSQQAALSRLSTAVQRLVDFIPVPVVSIGLSDLSLCRGGWTTQFIPSFGLTLCRKVADSGCGSIFVAVPAGTVYSRVEGWVTLYQQGTPNAFSSNSFQAVGDSLSIWSGSTLLWDYAVGLSRSRAMADRDFQEYTCPASGGKQASASLNGFWSCDSGNTANTISNDDFYNLPLFGPAQIFRRTLAASTSAPIELRFCLNQGRNDEEIYLQSASISVRP